MAKEEIRKRGEEEEKETKRIRATRADSCLSSPKQDPQDMLSLVCAYLALLPQALCIVYATLILSTREIEIALTFAGQLACEVLNFALKRFIKEERPPRMIHGQGYGMPSSHSQFVAFWSVSMALFLLVRHRPTMSMAVSPGWRNKKTATTTTTSASDRGGGDGGGGAGFLDNFLDMDRPWSLVERLGLSALTAGIAAATAWSRIYLNYHTTKQVLVGCGAGVISAVGWFLVVSVVRQTGLLAWALETPLARAFRIRDLVIEEDMCQAGWEKWEEKRTTLAKAKRK